MSEPTALDTLLAAVAPLPWTIEPCWSPDAKLMHLASNHLGALRVALKEAERLREAVQRCPDCHEDPYCTDHALMNHAVINKRRTALRNLERDAKQLLEGGA